MRMCISRASASRSIATIWRDVVPRTMESSITTTRRSFTMLRTGVSFILTPMSLMDWTGWMKVLATYMFLIRPISSGIPPASA